MFGCYTKITDKMIIIDTYVSALLPFIDIVDKNCLCFLLNIVKDIR
jgi:hypothetical protein